jgi:uncharacterized protein YndB with AHSA1/START domain
MTAQLLTRRTFSLRIASLSPLLGAAETILASPTAAFRVPDDELSHTAESIHQEVVFKASPKRVYDALTDAKQFTKVLEFTEMKNLPPAQISPEAGGSFSLFGGVIVGRNIELVPNRRIVQAWRVADSWEDGVYSIVRFELKEQAPDTRLVFDHRGFPTGQGEHLAAGWKIRYWQPLAKYLASSDSHS